MTLRLALACSAAVLLCACVVEAPPQDAPAAPAGSGQVSGAMLDACVDAVAAEAQNSVEATSSEFSEANSTVFLAVGPQRAPWRCLISNDGVVQEVEFMGQG